MVCANVQPVTGGYTQRRACRSILPPAPAIASSSLLLKSFSAACKGARWAAPRCRRSPVHAGIAGSWRHGLDDRCERREGGAMVSLVWSSSFERRASLFATSLWSAHGGAAEGRKRHGASLALQNLNGSQSGPIPGTDISC